VDVEAWAEWRAMRLAALRDAPYAFGAKLADWRGDRDSEHRWRQRLAGSSFNVVAELEGGAAGMASGVPTGQDDTVGLISMWVAPFARGRGVGDALVDAVLHWAEGRGAARVVLRVAADNDRAAALYRRHGFMDSASPGASRLVQREMVRVI
jgi:ribosomal protein S18 acetylase RimI-like enzyme